MKKLFCLLILFISLLFVTPISAKLEINDYSHANNHKKFKNANLFYKEMVSEDNSYIEYQNATLNIRTIILYKDLPDFLQKKLGDFSKIVDFSYLNRTTLIHKNRKVYFYLSSRDSELKYILIDAETRDGILGGSANIPIRKIEDVHSSSK